MLRDIFGRAVAESPFEILEGCEPFLFLAALLAELVDSTLFLLGLPSQVGMALLTRSARRASN